MEQLRFDKINDMDNDVEFWKGYVLGLLNGAAIVVAILALLLAFEIL